MIIKEDKRIYKNTENVSRNLKKNKQVLRKLKQAESFIHSA